MPSLYLDGITEYRGHMATLFSPTLWYLSYLSHLSPSGFARDFSDGFGPYVHNAMLPQAVRIVISVLPAPSLRPPSHRWMSPHGYTPSCGSSLECASMPRGVGWKVGVVHKDGHVGRSQGAAQPPWTLLFPYPWPLPCLPTFGACLELHAAHGGKNIPHPGVTGSHKAIQWRQSALTGPFRE